MTSVHEAEKERWKNDTITIPYNLAVRAIQWLRFADDAIAVGMASNVGAQGIAAECSRVATELEEYTTGRADG